MALDNNLVQDLRFTCKVMHHITAEWDDEAQWHWLQHVITTSLTNTAKWLDAHLEIQPCIQRR